MIRHHHDVVLLWGNTLSTCRTVKLESFDCNIPPKHPSSPFKNIFTTFPSASSALTSSTASPMFSTTTTLEEISTYLQSPTVGVVAICLICFFYFTITSINKKILHNQEETPKMEREHVELCEPNKGLCACPSIENPIRSSLFSYEVLPSIVNRRSIFPKSYTNEKVSPQIMKNILSAAKYAPYHGSSPPAHFVVLGKQGQREMQELTLKYYDNHWKEVGWANGKTGTEEEYQKWRAMTEGEIDGRWGPVSYMVAIIQRRGEQRIPEWEQAASVACAVQNMHIQACTHPGLACYWSSWHDASRDCKEMKDYLGMTTEDKLLGFFIVARCNHDLKDRRVRRESTHLSVKWKS